MGDNSNKATLTNEDDHEMQTLWEAVRCQYQELRDGITNLAIVRGHDDGRNNHVGGRNQRRHVKEDNSNGSDDEPMLHRDAERNGGGMRRYNGQGD
ncbi:hypothetical protein Pint_26746 [Pistacia integerrima]|uniref:Uncharacterized protein n=1 Tax=Pistacia integerrima TaxID=434235 RepID=A0ACC0YMX0_9ROSI|nr:hypothetical protein Pint_26746 [Pistacia integerrima]